MMKKTILSMVIAAGLLATVSESQAASNLTDIRGHWAFKSIEGAIERGYVDGYPDGTFKPEESITRAEFVKMVVDSLAFKTEPVPAYSRDPWYSNYMKIALANGLLIPDEYTNEQLNEKMTRLEMSKVVVRGTGQYNTDDLKWMYLATSKGLINGMHDEGALGIDLPTTRAQSVTIIERLLNVRNGKPAQATVDPTAKYAISAAEILWHRTNAFTVAPEYFRNAQMNNETFRWDKTRFESDLGYSEIEKFIVVDMGDPNDPNRKLIPDDFRWKMRVDNNFSFHQDVPLNTYAFLSFNHFVRYNADQHVSTFRFAHLSIQGSNLNLDSNIDETGNLIDFAGYGKYVAERESINMGGMRLEAGQSEVYIITGMIVPKKIKLKSGSTQTSIYKRAAAELGDKNVTVVLSSRYMTINDSEEAQK